MAGSNLGKPADGQSWFGLALNEWQELNLSSDFSGFANEIRGIVGSLTQVLFYKDRIIELLEKHLQEDGALAMAPLSALTATLVRDFGEEMVPHFGRLFSALLMALRKTNDVESLETVLGSLFFFFKNLLADVEKNQVIEKLVETLNVKDLRPQIQDFLAEFIIYTLSNHFDSKLLGSVLTAMHQTDLCACILAGSVLEKKKIDGQRLAAILSLIDQKLCVELIVSMIDRYGISYSWTSLAECVNADNVFINNLLRTITTMAEHQKGRLVGEQLVLLKALCTLPFTPTSQSAIISIIGTSSLSDVLPLRQLLHPFVFDTRGIALMTSSALQFIEPLIGSSNAVQVIVNSLFNVNKLAAIKIIERIICSLTATTLAQVITRLPIAELQKAVLSSDFDLVVSSISLLSRIPSLDTFTEFESLCKACPEYLSIRQWIEILFEGRSFVREINMSSLNLAIETTKGLELLGSSSSMVPDADLLLPQLLASDPRRRGLALGLISRIHDGQLISLCRKIEAIPWVFNSDREKGLLLQNLTLVMRKPHEQQTIELEIVVRYICGILLMGFLPIRQHLYNLLDVLVDHYSVLIRKILIEVVGKLSDFNGVGCLPVEIDAIDEVPKSKIELADDLLNKKFPNRKLFKDNPMFSDNSVEPLMHFLAHKTAAFALTIETWLPLCQAVFNDGLDNWFAKKLQSSLPDLLAALGGVKSVKSNPESLKIVSDLLHRFLGFGDSSIQKKALSSIFSLSLYEGLGLYEERLSRLLDDRKMKDELVLLAAEQSSLVQSDIWPNLSFLLISILYGRMIGKKGINSSRTSPMFRRKSVLNYIAIWDMSSIHQFMVFIKPNDPTLKRWIGALVLLQTLIHRFGKRITKVTVDMLLSWFEEVRETAKIEFEETQRANNLVVKRLLDLYSVLSSEIQIDPLLAERTWNLISDRIDRFEFEYVQESSAVLDLLHLWINVVQYQTILFGVGKTVWPRLAMAIGMAKAKDSVLLKLIKIWSLAIQSKHPIDQSSIDLLFQSLDVRIHYLLKKEKRSVTLLDHVVTLLLEVSDNTGDVKNTIITSLLQLVSVKRIREEIKTKLLQLAGKLYSDEFFAATYPIAVDLLVVLRQRESRFALAKLFDQLSVGKSELTFFSGILSDLHAPSTERIGEYDYERQNTAFSLLRSNIDQFSADGWRCVLKALFYFCHEDDTATKTHAFSILYLFLDRAQQNAELKSMGIRVIYPAIKRGLKSRNESIRVDFLTFFNSLISKFRLDEPFSSLVPLLAGDNEEANVFLNILHIQQHRRVRALKRLAEFALDVSLSRAIVKDIFFPLLGHFVFSDPTFRDPVPSSVVHEATMTMAVLHRHLPVKIVIKKMIQYSEQIRRGVPGEKTLIRLIAESLRHHLPSVIEPELGNVIIANLFTLLNGYTGKKKIFRAPVAIAIVEILVKLQDGFDGHLSKLIVQLASQLAHRHADRREESRDTLTSILTRIGTSHLHLVIRELKSSLVDGYKPHILAYVVNQILLKSAPLAGTALDMAVDDLVDIIIGDMFGERAREKEAKEWIGRIKEVKAKKSPETLKLLVKEVAFNKLISILQSVRKAAGLTTEVEWVEMACKAIELGLGERPYDGKIQEISSLIYVLLKEDSQFYTDGADLPSWKLHMTRFQLIGGRVLLQLLNPNVIDQSISDQLLPLLLNHIHGKSTALIVCSIKCLNILLKEPKSIGQPQSLLMRLFDLVVGSSGTKHAELTNGSFKLIITLVRDGDVSITERQLRFLLEYIMINLENESDGTIAYNLIRTILKRKIILPEVYELMGLIRKMIVHSFNPIVRQQCRSVFSLFLLDYPLGRKKLEEHLFFFVANLVYEVDGGRESAALFLGYLAERLPLKVILEMGESWLVALAARLVNEKGEKVLAAIREACAKIINKLDERIMDRVGLVLEKWLVCSPNENINRTAWTLLPIIIKEASIPITGLTNKLIEWLNRLVANNWTKETLCVLEAIMLRRPTSGACDLLMPLMKLRIEDNVLYSIRSRIIAAYFDQVGEQLKGIDGHLVDSSKLFEWSRPWMRELRSCNESTSDIIIKNLLFLCKLANSPSYIDGLSCKFEGIYRQIASGDSKIYATAMCKYYGAIILQFDSLSDILCSSILRATIRILANSTIASEELGLMAQQVSDLLSHKLGANKFNTLRISIIQDINLTKRKRTEDEAKLAIIDPKAYSKRRLQMQNRKLKSANKRPKTR